MVDRDVCIRINYQSTDCQVILNQPSVDDMREEIDRLETEHKLSQVRQGIFELPPQPIIIQPINSQDIKIKTYFEEN